MLALGGDVVVDYCLRVKKEYGAKGILIAGYSNDLFLMGLSAPSPDLSQARGARSEKKCREIMLLRYLRDQAGYTVNLLLLNTCPLLVRQNRRHYRVQEVAQLIKSSHTVRTISDIHDSLISGCAMPPIHQHNTGDSQLTIVGFFMTIPLLRKRGQ